MDNIEIATILTKTAIENGLFKNINQIAGTLDELSAANEFYAKIVADFYKAMLNNINGN